MSAFVYLNSKVKVIKLSLFISLGVTVICAALFLKLDYAANETFLSVVYYILFAGVYVSALSILVLLILRILRELHL